MSLGLFFTKIPNLALLAPVILSFFKFIRQVHSAFYRGANLRQRKLIPQSVVLSVEPHSDKRFLWVLESFLDTFRFQNFLIGTAIFQHSDWVKNGSKRKLGK